MQAGYEQAAYPQQGYAAPYTDVATAQYGQNPVYSNQAPQMHYDANSYVQAETPQQAPSASYTEGSAALDVYNNPYLSGQTAGAIDHNSQTAQAPYNPNAPQG